MTVKTEDRIQKIKELIADTDQIDTSDTFRMVELQDLLNIDGITAYNLWLELDQHERRRLLWIVTTTSGYDTFSWYLQNMIMPHFIAHIEDQYKTRELELHEKEKKINHKIDMYHERHGDLIAQLREQNQVLQARLDDETAKNRKVKALLRVLRRYLPIV